MNKLKLVNKKLISILILLLTYLIFSSNVFAEKKTYYPYPIIFVHGINSSAEKCWSGVEKHFLQNYFSNKEVTKYFPYGGDYLILVDYERQNVGDIPTIASEALKNVVGNAIKKLPDDYKKVIIVTHSMGGLVTRSFLKQYPDYHDKIAKVIFIGTPHRGSSFASALWILKKVERKLSQPDLAAYNKYYSRNISTRYRFSSSASQRGLSPRIYEKIKNTLMATATSIYWDLILIEKLGLNGDQIAVEQLRLDDNVYFEAKISGTNVTIEAFHSGDETFLGATPSNLGVPSNYRTIRGINTRGWKYIDWGLNPINNYKSYFTFPADMSLDDTVTKGDGIVPEISQKTLSDDYTVNAFHKNETAAVIEGQHVLLQAIEDRPEIENIEAIEVDETDESGEKEYYIKIKVKDYLLADIEIEEMTLDGEDIISDGFKPYYAPENEYAKFLKERDDPTAQITDAAGNPKSLSLLPGEFYVKETMTPNEEHEFYIKIRNPAEEFAQNGDFTAEETVYFCEENPTISVEDYNAIWGGCAERGGHGNPYTPKTSVDYGEIVPSTYIGQGWEWIQTEVKSRIGHFCPPDPNDGVFMPWYEKTDFPELDNMKLIPCVISSSTSQSILHDVNILKNVLRKLIYLGDHYRQGINEEKWGSGIGWAEAVANFNAASYTGPPYHTGGRAQVEEPNTNQFTIYHRRITFPTPTPPEGTQLVSVWLQVSAGDGIFDDEGAPCGLQVGYSQVTTPYTNEIIPVRPPVYRQMYGYGISRDAFYLYKFDFTYCVD